MDMLIIWLSKYFFRFSKKNETKTSIVINSGHTHTRTHTYGHGLVLKSQISFRLLFFFVVKFKTEQEEKK